MEFSLDIVKYCKCGCGNTISIRPFHKTRGIPDYIMGHNSKGANNGNYRKIKNDVVCHCDNCGKDIDVMPCMQKAYKTHFCDMKCSAEYKTKQGGVNHPLYKAEEVPCSECGKMLIRNQSRLSMYKDHFCNQECSGKFKSKIKGELHPIYKKVQCNCSNCGTVIMRDQIEIDKKEHIYCDKKCMAEHRNKIDYYKGENNSNYRGEDTSFTCDWCGNVSNKKCPANIKNQEHHFCNMDCMSKWKSENLTGENAYNWRGGNGTLLNNIRRLTQGTDWALIVLIRDEYKCQVCKKGSNKLNAHHLKGFKQIVDENNISNSSEAQKCEELWSVDNGVTMCRKCHIEFHKLYGVYKFTPSDFEEFKNLKLKEETLCQV